MQYSISAYDDEELRTLARNAERNSALLAALDNFEVGDYISGHELLEQAVKKGMPEALLISATFSKEEEDMVSFSRRHVEYVKKAADQSLPLALYTLGVYYDVGEYLQHDESLAHKYFRYAAELGHPKSMYIYGIYLYFRGDAVGDKRKGYNLIQKSAELGEYDAIVFLKDNYAPG